MMNTPFRHTAGKRQEEPTALAGGSPAPASRPLDPGDEFGPYSILKRIGAGGYGEVFLAVHRLLRRRAALKIIHADLAAEPHVVELFLREARLVARFDHPNVVSVYDAGRGDNGRLFMAMRFVPGGSLDDRIDREGALPEPIVFHILRDCCAGLAAIHGLGLMHRDIKPANILIETDGRACLTDFGLASFHRERLPYLDDEHSIGGTLLYLAPEQLDGDVIATPQTDLYALGIAFTAAATGTAPLDTLSHSEVIRRKCNGKLVDPQDLRPGLGSDLAALLRDLTARDPSKRPPDVMSVLTRVEALLDHAEGRKPYAPPAKRTDAAALAAAASRLASDPLLKALLNAYPGPALVLDRRRQIVAASDTAIAFFGQGDPQSLLGRRPGEALGCIGAERGTGGCGTGPGCAFCGLGRLLSEAEQGRPTPLQGPFRVSRRGATGGASEFAIRLSDLPRPAGTAGVSDRLMLVTLRDTSAETRRRLFERSLVDNLLDAATVVRSIAESSGRVATAGDAAAERPQVTSLLSSASHTLAEEALFHQYLLAAEAGELQPIWEDVDVRALLADVARLLRHHPVSAGRRLHVRCTKACRVRTDRALLQRAVRNLVRNALEACPPGDRVDVEAATTAGGGVEISFRNPQIMKPEVREQVFQRSFSTKSAEGRGIGLHAARLFVETYLQGQIRFASEAPTGTTFWIRLPPRPQTTVAASVLGQAPLAKVLPAVRPLPPSEA
jgi:signal transduction histidine kinase